MVLAVKSDAKRYSRGDSSSTSVPLPVDRLLLMMAVVQTFHRKSQKNSNPIVLLNALVPEARINAEPLSSGNPPALQLSLKLATSWPSSSGCNETK